ncbi:type II toxin-antitoxin system VapC family toxin [Spirosoma horti]
MFLDNARVIDITDLILKNYVDLDAYSQRNHPEFLTCPFTAPRTIGKHDLWIAATASLLNLTLVTTDGDFDHLQNVFLDLRRIFPTSYAPCCNSPILNSCVPLLASYWYVSGK